MFLHVQDSIEERGKLLRTRALEKMAVTPRDAFTDADSVVSLTSKRRLEVSHEKGSREALTRNVAETNGEFMIV